MDENVEYEEREDEFDIVSRHSVQLPSGPLNTDHDATSPLQEDEAEIARRKMLEEEEDVDIEGEPEDVVASAADAARQNGDQDEDTLWALEEPDDDEKGWRMKVLIEDDQEAPY